mmetsp:Transcript_13897/g.37842  ORF Transcript_13897/g.37842 Transcript_13897/m.37842 type:complete len:208 (+) Transcript_13897:159-782(+)
MVVREATCAVAICKSNCTWSHLSSSCWISLCWSSQMATQSVSIVACDCTVAAIALAVASLSLLFWSSICAMDFCEARRASSTLSSAACFNSVIVMFACMMRFSALAISTCDASRLSRADAISLVICVLLRRSSAIFPARTSSRSLRTSSLAVRTWSSSTALLFICKFNSSSTASTFVWLRLRTWVKFLTCRSFASSSDDRLSLVATI